MKILDKYVEGGKPKIRRYPEKETKPEGLPSKYVGPRSKGGLKPMTDEEKKRWSKDKKVTKRPKRVTKHAKKEGKRTGRKVPKDLQGQKKPFPRPSPKPKRPTHEDLGEGVVGHDVWTPGKKGLDYLPQATHPRREKLPQTVKDRRTKKYSPGGGTPFAKRYAGGGTPSKKVGRKVPEELQGQERQFPRPSPKPSTVPRRPRTGPGGGGVRRERWEERQKRIKQRMDRQPESQRPEFHDMLRDRRLKRKRKLDYVPQSKRKPTRRPAFIRTRAEDKKVGRDKREGK